MKKLIMKGYGDQPVLFFKDNEEYSSFVKRKKIGDDFDSSGYAGHSGVIGTDGGLPVMFYIVCEDQTLETACHESLHCAMNILHALGIDFGAHNQEPLCYLHEYIFKEYCKYTKITEFGG